MLLAQNRRTRGLYQSATPSRFVDELPGEHLDIVESKSPYGGGGAAYRNLGYSNPYGASRFDERAQESYKSSFTSSYDTPGWQRAKEFRRERDEGSSSNFSRDTERKAQRAKAARGGPVTIEGELVASSTANSRYSVGQRVLHLKFGYGRVTAVDGNKLTIQFDKAGEKKVVDSFVKAA